MPPKRMKITAVPDLVEIRTGRRPSIQTVYNWINLGVKGEKLRVTFHRRCPASVFPDLRLTTRADVDDFINKVGSKVGM